MQRRNARGFFFQKPVCMCVLYVHCSSSCRIRLLTKKYSSIATKETKYKTKITSKWYGLLLFYLCGWWLLLVALLFVSIMQYINWTEKDNLFFTRAIHNIETYFVMIWRYTEREIVLMWLVFTGIIFIIFTMRARRNRQNV